MPIKVIGAGLGRTGTTSLKIALEMLGFGPCYHMREVFGNPKALAGWATLARGGTVDWDELLKGYVSTTDWPACDYWRELMARYPDAKIILTERDPERWFESVQATIFSPANLKRHLAIDPGPDTEAMLDAVLQGRFGGRAGDKAHAIAVYTRHNEEVKRGAPKDGLLVFHPKDGWEPLAKFLGVAAPSEPFPSVNTRDEFIEGLEEDLSTSDP